MSVKSLLLAGVMMMPVVATHAQDSASATGFVLPAPAQPFAAKAATVAKSTAAPFVLEREAVPSAETDSNDAQPAKKEVDISALRYYASQNDLSRVSAEIRLLRAKNPNWEPPADLFSETRSTVDEQPLWDLFSKHDMTGLKAAIDEMKQSKPDWQPSTELAQKMAMADAHDELVAASDGKRWSDVVDVATSTQGLLTCQDVDAIWRTAEALTKLDDEAHATAAYRYVLTSCNSPKERLATVQKASVTLRTPGALEGLLSLGRRTRDGRNELESVRLDGVRREIGDAAAGKATEQPSEADLAAMESAFASEKAPADAQLLGWYWYSRKDFAKAEGWFRSAMAIKPSPKVSEGLVLASREQGKLQDALNLAMQDRDLDPANRKVFVELCSNIVLDTKSPVALKPDQVAAFQQAIDTQQSPEGAQAFGWRLYNASDIAGAESWFRKSMGWQANENAAIGLMITARRLHHDRDYAELVTKYRAQFTRVAELETALRARPPVRVARVVVHGGHGQRVTRVARRGSGSGGGGEGWDASADAIVQTFKAGQYDQTVAMLDARKAGKAEPSGLSIIRGWAQYHRGDWNGAQQTFGALEQKGASHDAETGLRVVQEGFLPPRMR